MLYRIAILAAVLSVAITLLALTPSDPAQVAEHSADTHSSLADGALEPYRSEMLDFAFAVASSIPVDLHAKDQARAQEDIVSAAIGLDQLSRALTFIEQMQGWRRGLSFANLAFHLAQQGHRDVEQYLAQAEHIASRSDDWRADRIRARLAQTYALLGEDEQAERIDAALETAEQGKVLHAKILRNSGPSFEESMQAIDAGFATGSFDVIKNTLPACIEVFEQEYHNIERREQVERSIRNTLRTLPVIMKFDILARLADVAIRHGDESGAMTHINHAQSLLEAKQLMPEMHVVALARIAKLLFDAGEQEAAQSQIAGALALYQSQMHRIINIDRADVLRAIAEAMLEMGDTEQARITYGRAIEAGIENPNSRPRALDLAATARSMAAHNFERPAEMQARMHDIRKHLDHPW